MFLSVVCSTVRAVEEYRRTYRSGLSRFDEKRDPVDHQIDPVLPAGPGPVHAVPVTRVDRGRWRPQLFTSPPRYKTALCGAAVKVELPMEFDPGDEDSCRKCIGPALRDERTSARGWVCGRASTTPAPSRPAGFPGPAAGLGTTDLAHRLTAHWLAGTPVAARSNAGEA